MINCLTIFHLFSKAMPKKESFDCTLCSAQFTGFNQKWHYDLHIETCHFDSVEGIKQFSCDNCPFRTGSICVLKTHVKKNKKSCQPDRKYLKCEYCDRLAAEKYKQMEHMKKFHGDKLEGKMVVYSCASCNYKTANNNHFYKHKLLCVMKSKSDHILDAKPTTQETNMLDNTTKPQLDAPLILPPDFFTRIQVIPIANSAIKKKTTPKVDSIIQVVP